MLRTFLSFACAAVVFWCSSDTMAFTLQFAPSATAERFEAAQTTNGADVPTPQLFRIVISRDGVRQEALPYFPPYPEVVPAVRFQEAHPVRTTTTPPTPPGTTTAHHLSGAELLLLRQTETVAGK
jgi:hypothetical protein